MENPIQTGSSSMETDLLISQEEQRVASDKVTSASLRHPTSGNGN